MDSRRQHSVSGEIYPVQFLIMMELEIQGKNGQFKEWLRGAKYSNLSNASGFNRAKLILLEDLPGYLTVFYVTIFSRG